MNRHDSANHLITTNRLLGALPARELKRALSNLEEVELRFGASIYAPGGKIEYAYFPISGIISLLAGVDNDSTLEIGIVGREGMAGLPLFMGTRHSPVRAIVQGKGSAMRMKAADFENECGNGGALPQILLRFAHSIIGQISQSAVCFRFHVIEMRLARWLLMTGDRMETEKFRMTQDFLSNMLGVRREAVNRAATSLQRKGLIEYSRSNILITDRAALETAACKCYSILRAEEMNLRAVA